MRNSNPVVHVLVLARPADSVCAILAAALRQWRYEFSVYSTVYEVVSGAKDISASQSLVLVTRPAMLGPQAPLFLEQNFPNLRIVGWVDSEEKVSDCAIAQTTAKGMIMASRLDQLQQAIEMLGQSTRQEQPASNAGNVNSSRDSERLNYQLSEDEVNALLEAQ